MFGCATAKLESFEEYDTSAISGVPRPKGTHLLILSGPGQGAELTVGAPASASITATL